MLYLYQSDRLEFLAETAVALMQHAPLGDAFATEELVVQSQGMRRYLSRYLAERSGVAANLRFSLPAALSWRLTRRFLPDAPKLNPFAPEVLRWRLLGLFQDGGLPEAVHSALRGYLNSGPSAPYRLAGKVADVFDQYLVYRPDWLAAWEAGNTVGLGGDEVWQAQLWQRLAASSPGSHRARQRQDLLAALDAARLPERYLVFGLSALAPMYLELLQALAVQTDVYLFALNPSSRYWGDIESARQTARSSLPDAAAGGHPLLASFGRQGRDFFDMLAADSRIGGQEDLFAAAPPEPTLLERLQDDIRCLRLPEAGSAQTDGSIVIQSAHSPLRELQVLKEWLLAVLDGDRSLQPHQIAVLTPDIETYAPFIHAVFGEEQIGSYPLPYSIADVQISRRHALMQLAAHLPVLMQGRFETEQVLPLLDAPAVRRHWDFSERDADILRHSAAELNIHWGADAAMRAQYGGQGTAFTWQQGQERTVLGWLMPENGSGLWQGTAPWAADWAQTGVQARWLRLLSCLRRHHAEWQQPAAPAVWCARFRELLHDVCGEETDDAGEQAVRQQLAAALAAWQEESALAGYLKPLPPAAACEHLARFFSTADEAGFLRGGITFCGMVPMRSLPFDTLCLIGLNDGRFPRRTQTPVFDLISRHPRKGDRARRDDDRYLFLESLLSARRRLYLSYVGRDIRKDDILAPSPLLGELADVLAQMTGRSSAEFAAAEICQHPLQAFSPKYFSGSLSGSLSGSREDYAEALNRPPVSRQPFAEDAVPAAECADDVGLDTLLRFWRNPVRYWLAQALQWREPYAETVPESAEPYDLVRRSEVSRSYLDARRRHRPFAETEAVLAAESAVPAGLLGSLFQARERDAVKRLDGRLLHSAKLPARPFVFRSGGLNLSGTFNHLYADGQIFYLSAPPSAPDTVALWLQHLVYCAAAPQGTAGATHIVCPAEPQSLPPLEAETARRLLGVWLAYYRLGHSRPLPFFAKTSLAAARAYTEPAEQPPEAAVRAARNEYRDNKQRPGQGSRTEVAQVFGRDETEPTDTPLFWHLVQDLLVPLHLHFGQAGQEDGGG